MHPCGLVGLRRILTFWLPKVNTISLRFWLCASVILAIISSSLMGNFSSPSSCLTDMGKILPVFITLHEAGFLIAQSILLDQPLSVFLRVESMFNLRELPIVSDSTLHLMFKVHFYHPWLKIAQSKLFKSYITFIYKYISLMLYRGYMFLGRRIFLFRRQ